MLLSQINFSKIKNAACTGLMLMKIILIVVPEIFQPFAMPLPSPIAFEEILEEGNDLLC
jgi:hypothetical protein